MQLGVNMTKLRSIVSLLFTAHLSPKFKKGNYSYGKYYRKKWISFQSEYEIIEGKWENLIIFRMIRIPWLKNKHNAINQLEALMWTNVKLLGNSLFNN